MLSQKYQTTMRGNTDSIVMNTLKLDLKMHVNDRQREDEKKTLL